MNIWILSAGILGLFTTLVHVFAGQVDPVKPFLKSNLDPIPKATLLACWHLVSATLLFNSLILTYTGWFSFSQLYTTTLLLGLLYLLFTLVFISVGWYFFKLRVFFTLPQWILLLPIGLLATYGSM
ncbi:hypothetical protein EGH82_08770 [Vibrio ponticus]|uniref:Uncharacterized protein n=1 Tax=Vibrio ponticus TaxID=265668 RepID=A0A3N3E1G8_9VIBR|nr:hypothetical protein [Vibrio ponticus]ROV60591.1 hypothetical protein EGH82_08770 [Vibrio ponticus]